MSIVYFKRARKFICGLAAVSSMAFASNSMAEIVAGVGYGRISDGDISLSAIQGTLGWKMETASGFAIIPEVKFGTGISDDSVLGVDVEVKSALGINLRAEWALENIYIYVAPSYTNLEVEATAFGVSATADDWEFGGGVGIGYRLTDWTALEVSYEDFAGTSIIGASIRFEFN